MLVLLCLLAVGGMTIAPAAATTPQVAVGDAGGFGAADGDDGGDDTFFGGDDQDDDDGGGETFFGGQDRDDGADGVATGQAENASVPCPVDRASWREAQTIDGVEIQASQRCMPDDPNVVAAAVAGTNNVNQSTLMRSGLARDAVVKHTDRDGDGDPDVINVTLEVTGINERNETDVTHEIAPGIDPAFWTFAPKTRGMVRSGSRAQRVMRPPSPTIRAETGDTVYVTVENTHYFPHTIHLHGTDHPFEVGVGNTSGNDGVPQTSEEPLMPGEKRTYKLTPRQAGTMFYHCHVVPNVHVGMGLNGLFVVEQDAPDNRVQTLNVGAGKVRHSSAAIDAGYQAEYDMVYQSLSEGLHEIPKQYDDTRRLAYEINRNWSITDADAEYFLLNGRSFPYTTWESVVNVEPDQRYRLRMLNVGGETMSIHTHGHKFFVEALDGVPLGFLRFQRDTLTLSAAQRADLTLNTKDDGRNAYGNGSWFMHDHREQGVTNAGMAPGGTVTMINYPAYRTAAGLPATNVDLRKYFDPAFYEGEIPVWESLDEDLYGSPPGVEDGSDAHDGEDGSTDDGHDDHATAESSEDTAMDGGNMSMDDGDGSMDGMMGGMMGMEMRMVPNGTVVNENVDELPPGCSAINGTRNLTVDAGHEFADEGEAFSYRSEEFEFEACTRVNVTVVNHDEIRHQWMIHGLPTETYPMGMFNVEVRRHGSVDATFVTPADPSTFTVHCSLPQHEQKGMHAAVHVAGGGDHAGH